ncbi:hypothetical protein B0H19DRAFT_1082850 [Mycena capillaripes]|nr:hypothetical protein B0H19DRAFT_1082850 [Mycena capillaripes]
MRKKIVGNLTQNYPILASNTSFLPTRPLCFPNDSPGKVGFKNKKKINAADEGAFVIANAAAVQDNIQVDLKVVSTGKILAPVMLSAPVAVAATDPHVKVNLDCVTRELSVPGLTPRFCVAAVNPTTRMIEQFCGSQAGNVRECYRAVLGKRALVMDNTFF